MLICLMPLDELGKLGTHTQLESLSLANDSLTALPESFGRLKQLRGLDLVLNQLMDLPESFANLSI